MRKSRFKLRFPDDRLSVVALANRGGFNAEKLAMGIVGALAPDLVQSTTPISDPGPSTTRRLRRVLLEMMAGEMNPDGFSKMLNRELGLMVKGSQAEVKARAADDGELERFVLLERNETAQGIDRVYRSDFEHQTRVKLFVSLDSAGLIANWGVRPAE